MGACHAWEHTLIIYHIERGDRPLELFKILGTIAVDNSSANKSINETSGHAENAHSKMSTAFSKMGSAAAAVGKAIAAGLAVGTAAIGALAKASIENYADYEQLVGGVETLFAESADRVMEYANNAYKTAGLSANDYMETVTSFSASLLQSLGGDTAEAARVADMAITDMSDNANKMGSDMSMIQNAYQGFAKQNYTMLDNLKLGYGGTKEEMKRLLADATALSGVKYDLESYADIIDAIHVIQDEMGITGTTAAEASETISGSIGTMKAAWTNFLTGVADGTQDFGKLANNLVNSVISVAKNVIPRIQVLLPQLVEGLSLLAESLLPEVMPIIMSLAPSVFQAAVGLLGAVITLFLPELAKAITETVTKIVETLTDPNTLSSLMDAAISVLFTLIEFLVANVTLLIDAAVEIIVTLVNFLLEEENLEKLLVAAGEMVVALSAGLIESAATLVEAAIELTAAIIEAVFATDWVAVGKAVVEAIGEGMSKAWLNFEAKNPLAAKGMLEGLNLAVSGGMINGTHADGLDYVPYDGYIAELHKGEMVVPALESKFLRSGTFGNAEVVPLLERILFALEDRESETMSVVLNNREFARLVKAVN